MIREFPVAFEIDVALPLVGDWKDVADLRADADYAGFEWAQLRSATLVRTKLLIEIAHRSD